MDYQDERYPNLVEARKFRDDYVAWLQQLPADIYNARIEELQAELATREAAMEAALEQKLDQQEIEARTLNEWADEMAQLRLCQKFGVSI